MPPLLQLQLFFETLLNGSYVMYTADKLFHHPYTGCSTCGSNCPLGIYMNGIFILLKHCSWWGHLWLEYDLSHVKFTEKFDCSSFKSIQIVLDGNALEGWIFYSIIEDILELERTKFCNIWVNLIPRKKLSHHSWKLSHCWPVLCPCFLKISRLF